VELLYVARKRNYVLREVPINLALHAKHSNTSLRETIAVI